MAETNLVIGAINLAVALFNCWCAFNNHRRAKANLRNAEALATAGAYERRAPRGVKGDSDG